MASDGGDCQEGSSLSLLSRWHFFFGPPGIVLEMGEGEDRMVPKTAIQIYYKDITMALLVTFQSTWLPNLVETRFCLSQLQKMGEGSRWSVKVSSKDVPARMEKGRGRA